MAKDWPPSFPFERQKEKKEGEREEIWRRKEEELAGPPFFLSSLLSSSSLPSLCLAPPPPPPLSLFLSFFLLLLLGRKWKVKGEQEVRRHSLGVCVVKLWKASGCRGEGTFFSGSVCGGRLALTWRHIKRLHVRPFHLVYVHISTYGT